MAQRLKLVTLPSVTVVTAGAEQPASSSNLEVYSAIIISLSTNTGTQYVGDSTVTSSTGMTLAPDGSLELGVPENMRATDTFNLAEVYLDSSSDAAEFRIAAWVRG
jgi:hypothetical protein